MIKDIPQDKEDVKLLYANFLKGKKIVVVVPSSHLIGSNNGKLIDSYDLVIRVSIGYKVPSRLRLDFGTRTDILYNSMLPQRGSGITMPIGKLKKELKWVCASYPAEKHIPNIKNFIKKNNSRIPFHIVDKNYWDFLTSVMRIPNVGTVAIFDSLNHDISELYVTGITFYQKAGKKDGTFYYNGYQKDSKRIPTNTSKHRPRKQFKYFRKIYKKDKRIKCDNFLKGILEK